MNPSPELLGPEQLAAVEGLRARFAQLPGSRMAGRVMHRIDEVVMITLCSVPSKSYKDTQFMICPANDHGGTLSATGFVPQPQTSGLLSVSTLSPFLLTFDLNGSKIVLQ